MGVRDKAAFFRQSLIVLKHSSIGSPGAFFVFRV
ncbi:hypothetical protein ATCR1_23733 [Agrobacterium tumefaciens CCNWGS0286]|nr:hypothetical protein ATCR1_23733 [Agrobacterium tumefaciens CCNWGS0286]